MCRPVCMAVMWVLVFAWSAAAERLPVTSFTTVNGLPHDRIKRIVRDSKGFLWFGTATGLSRFDGERFVTYTVAHGLSHSSINDLVEASDGTYWIATNGGGVCRFQPTVQGRETSDGAAPRHAFTCLQLGNVAANRVNAVLADRRGRIWAATDRGLYRLDPADQSNSFVPVPSKKSGGNVWALAEDRDGHVWVGHANGLTRHTAGGLVRDYDLSQHGGSSNVWALLSDRAGRLWLGRDGGLLVVLPLPVREADAQPPLWQTLLRTSPISDA